MLAQKHFIYIVHGTFFFFCLFSETIKLDINLNIFSKICYDLSQFISGLGAGREGSKILARE